MVQDYVVLSEKDYEEPKKGGSIVSGSLVEVIGEKTVRFDDGTVGEFYMYNIVGHKARNGKPFAALKDNIVIM